MVWTPLLRDYDRQTFVLLQTRANYTPAVWLLNMGDIWNLAQRVADRSANDEDIELFLYVLLVRVIPAEAFKRLLRASVDRCTVGFPIRETDPEFGLTLCLDVLLFHHEDHTEERSVGYVIRRDGWWSQCQGFGGSRIHEKFELWTTPPHQLQGARLRNAQRSKRRRLRSLQRYNDAVEQQEEQPEQGRLNDDWSRAYLEPGEA